jgi:hypothetical protein
MNIKYIVKVEVNHVTHYYMVINGFPLHFGDKIRSVSKNKKTIVFYVDDWHLREDQTQFLLTRKQKGILSYTACPVAGPSIAKEKASEYALIAS